MYEESGTIIANSLKRNLGIVLTDQQKQMVRNWKNPVNEIDRDSRGQFFSDLEKLLRTIYEKNKNDLFYDENALVLRKNGLKFVTGSLFTQTYNVLRLMIFLKIEVRTIFGSESKYFGSVIKESIEKLRRFIKNSRRLCYEQIY